MAYRIIPGRLAVISKEREMPSTQDSLQKDMHVMKILFASLITLLLAACSSVKPYPNLPKKNFSIQAVTDAGSLLTNVKAHLDIHSVKPDCSTIYIGTVNLDKPLVEIGIPNKPSYLAFVFNTSGFLKSNSGSLNAKTFFKPKPGYRYMAKVSYIDEIFDVQIFEMNPGGQSKELGFRDLDSCEAQ
jgi:hypothetical protein